MIVVSEFGSCDFSEIDLKLLDESIDERIQLTDVGTKKHRDYKRLYDKLKKLIPLRTRQ